jgi:hypothetical protein
MTVVRFLERKWVIQMFGVALIVAPFVNILIQFLVLNSKTGISWRYISISAYLLSGSITNYILSFGSLIIGGIMLSGSTKAWKAVLCLVGSHIIMQILNYKTAQFQGVIGWTAFIVNISVFLFIADQLVWRIKTKEELLAEAAKIIQPVIPQPKNPVIEKAPERILHLTSYKKICFSFGSDRPWGRLMTMTSHQLIVNCFGEAPQGIDNKIVSINFAKNIVVDIKFDRKENNLYYFTPMNMTPERIKDFNGWLKKIAV